MSDATPARRFGVALAAALVAAVMATVTARAADDDPEPPDGDGGERANACSTQQLEGGYEDIGGRCQLTGWNWDFGPCRYGADVGRLGDPSSSCTPGGCVTETCGGGSGTGGGNDDGHPSRPDTWDVTPSGVEDFDDFRSKCEAAGGSIEIVDLLGDESDWAGNCFKDGFVLGGCLQQDDLEPECNVLDPPLPCSPGTCEPPNEYPAPEPGGPIVEVGPATIDEAAPPAGDPAPAGGVIVDAGAGAPDDMAPAGDEPEPATTIAGGIAPIDPPVAAGFAAGSPAAAPPEAPPTGLFVLPGETIDALGAAAGPLADPAAAAATGRTELLCVDHAGHYFASPPRVVDGALDPLDPEALVYADVDGRRQLVAVAWMSTAPAQVLGVPLHLDRQLEAFVLHAWVGLDNPAGLLADRHPAVGPCGEAPDATTPTLPFTPAAETPPTTEPAPPPTVAPATTAATTTTEPAAIGVVLSATQLDFGRVEVGDFVGKFVVVTNGSPVPVSIDPDSGDPVSPPYSVSSNCPNVLAAGETCRLTYGFRPDYISRYDVTASVGVRCDSCGTTEHLSISLHGVGAPPGDPPLSIPPSPAGTPAAPVSTGG